MSGRATALRRARIVKRCMIEAGVPEVSIELQPGRPAPGDEWNALNPIGVLSHHIASRPTPSNPTPGLALVKKGRSDLPGPLCNGTAGVDLVYRILTLGYANHSGEGGSLRLSGPLGSYTIPRDVGRPYLWGTEFEGGYDNAVWDRVYTNRRTGKSMTFREFMGRCNAGLVKAIWLINSHGKTPKPGMDLSGYHGEHKTWAPGRKPDRHEYTTESGRAEVRRFTEEDDVSAEDVWKHPIPRAGGEDGPPIPAGKMLAQTRLATKNTRKAVEALADHVEKVAPGAKKVVREALDTDEG